MTARRSLVVTSVIAGLAAALLGLVMLGKSREPASPPIARLEKKAVAEESHQRARAARREAAVQGIAALATALAAGDRTLASEHATALARLGPDAVEPSVEALRTERSWAFRMALLDVLASIRAESAVAGLVEVYGGLKEQETALKIEIVRRLTRRAGTPSREALAALLAKETASRVRDEISQGLLALGLTPDDAAKMGPAERAALEPAAQARADMRRRLEAVEQADARTNEGFAALRKAALEEDTIAVALSAFSKLEVRDDAAATKVLVDRVGRGPESDDAKILRTNALASLTRMRSSDARLAVRAIALGDDPELRVQAVEILGGFGDPAMLPVVDQALAMDKSERMTRAAERARTALQSREKNHGTTDGAPR